MNERGAMVVAKYLVVMISSLISSLLSLLSLYIASLLQEYFVKATPGQSLAFTLNPVELVIVLIAAISITAYISAIEVAVSIFARKVREAQTYLSPLAMIVFVPGILVGFVNASYAPNWYFDIPVFGPLLLIKWAILGTINWSNVFQVIVITIVLTAVCLNWATRQFRKENVIFRQ